MNKITAKKSDLKLKPCLNRSCFVRSFIWPFGSILELPTFIVFLGSWMIFELRSQNLWLTNLADFIERFLKQGGTRLAIEKLVFFGFNSRKRNQRSIQSKDFHSENSVVRILKQLLQNIKIRQKIEKYDTFWGFIKRDEDHSIIESSHSQASVGSNFSCLS